jgi:hypothetical protein
MAEHISCVSGVDDASRHSHHAPSNLTQTDFGQTEKARAELAKAEGKFEEYKKDAEARAAAAKTDALKKIDKFDATIEKKASEAKSGLSSWFGGK